MFGILKLDTSKEKDKISQEEHHQSQKPTLLRELRDENYSRCLIGNHTSKKRPESIFWLLDKTLSNVEDKLRPFETIKNWMNSFPEELEMKEILE